MGKLHDMPQEGVDLQCRSAAQEGKQTEPVELSPRMSLVTSKSSTQL